MIIRKLPTDGTVNLDENTLVQYLTNYRMPFPVIKDFIIAFSNTDLEQNSTLVQFHYFYNHPSSSNILEQHSLFFIDALAVNIPSGVHVINPNRILVFAGRSTQHYYHNTQTSNNTTTLLFSSYPDEQGMLVKVMTLRRNIRDSDAANYSRVYLIARAFNIDQAQIQNADSLVRYWNIIMWNSNDQQLAQKIYCATSWYFDLLLPFRVEIGDVLPDGLQ